MRARAAGRRGRRGVNRGRRSSPRRRRERHRPFYAATTIARRRNSRRDAAPANGGDGERMGCTMEGARSRAGGTAGRAERRADSHAPPSRGRAPRPSLRASLAWPLRRLRAQGRERGIEWKKSWVGFSSVDAKCSGSWRRSQLPRQLGDVRRLGEPRACATCSSARLSGPRWQRCWAEQAGRGGVARAGPTTQAAQGEGDATLGQARGRVALGHRWATCGCWGAPAVWAGQGRGQAATGGKRGGRSWAAESSAGTGRAGPRCGGRPRTGRRAGLRGNGEKEVWAV
jgi:hypothetical protein